MASKYTGGNHNFAMLFKRSLATALLLLFSTASHNQESVVRIYSYQEQEARMIGACQAAFLSAIDLSDQAYEKMTALKIVIPDEKLAELALYQERMGHNIKVFGNYFKEKNARQAGMTLRKFQDLKKHRDQAFQFQSARFKTIMDGDHLTDIEKASFENAFSLKPVVRACVSWYAQDTNPKWSI